MNARQRDRAKRAAKHREKLAAESRLEQRIESIMTGCSGRVSKALNGTLTLRSKEDKYPPIYTPKAKHQKVANEYGRQIHAVQKVRGSSIPLI